MQIPIEQVAYMPILPTFDVRFYKTTQARRESI